MVYGDKVLHRLAKTYCCPRRNFYGEHLGEVNLQLAPMDEVDTDGQALARRWRELVGLIPDAVSLTFSSATFDAGEPVNLQLTGRDVDELRMAAVELKSQLSRYDGVIDIADSFRAGKQEIKLALLPEARNLGLTLNDLARQVRAAFYGAEVQRVQRGQDEVRVMVRYPDLERRSIGNLEDMRIRTPDGSEVPFTSVATFSIGRSYSQINRVDGQRVINVTTNPLIWAGSLLYGYALWLVYASLSGIDSVDVGGAAPP